MEKAVITFENFLNDVPPELHEFVSQIHALLTGKGCGVKIEAAKSGFVLSYSDPKKRVLSNYVFRKSGLVIRIYADAVNAYPDFLETLPDGMKKAIEKAPVCRRLIDFTKCNSRCRMGYDFVLGGARYQKCQYSCFMFPVNLESEPFIRAFLENELGARMNHV